jgi:hypothetical protein
LLIVAWALFFLPSTCWITLIYLLYTFYTVFEVNFLITMFISNTIITALCFLAAQGNAARVNKTRISSSILSKTATAVTPSQTAAILNATVLDCFVKLPANPLTATGLSTPFLLQAPCSQSVATQQSFAEAAIYDPATGNITIYHPLISDEGKPVAAAPVVPVLPSGAVVALWFGFNGGVLQLLDANGLDTNNSPALKNIDCVNGLPGVQGDVFGQVSWCNAQGWFTAANAGIASGKTIIPDLGVDKLGNACPTSRSFEITDACPSDNVPTQYLLLSDGSVAQDTAANRAAHPGATVINNASDEALLTNIIDPLIGCTPFVAPSLDNPGESVPALALSELQASAKQLAPIGLVPLNDPDTLLTASGTVSTDKTNAYRLGVNQPVVGTGDTSGALIPYCQDMVSVAPPFLKGFETIFAGQTTPDACVGTNLFTFLANRYLMSLTQLTCPPSAIPFQPVVCQLNGNGVATSCVITLQNSTTTASTAAAVATVKTSANVAIVSPTSKALITSAAAVANAVTTSPTLVLTSTASTKTVVVEVITFFVFFLSLGSPAPGVTFGEEGFVVLEEVFADLPSAANQACTHQFNACAAFAGDAFAGTDCLSQMSQCQGAASTASPTASTPGTLTQTATVPKSATVTGTGTGASILGVVQTAGPAASSLSAAAACPAKREVTIVERETVTITSIALPEQTDLRKRHGHGHLDWMKH